MGEGDVFPESLSDSTSQPSAGAARSRGRQLLPSFVQASALERSRTPRADGTELRALGDEESAAATVAPAIAHISHQQVHQELRFLVEQEVSKSLPDDIVQHIHRVVVKLSAKIDSLQKKGAD